MTSSEVLAVAREVARELAARGAEAVALAGSHVRGEAHSHSDVDLLAVGEASELGDRWAQAQAAALGLGGEGFDESRRAALELCALAAAEVRHLLDERQRAVVELQRLVYRVGEAVRRAVPTERLYILSLGSRQGNRHVHWHVAPLPPGVPYEEQQLEALRVERGVLDLSDEELSSLAKRIRAELHD